jgi:hypothetical protein
LFVRWVDLNRAGVRTSSEIREFRRQQQRRRSHDKPASGIVRSSSLFVCLIVCLFGYWVSLTICCSDDDRCLRIESSRQSGALEGAVETRTRRSCVRFSYRLRFFRLLVYLRIAIAESLVNNDATKKDDGKTLVRLVLFVLVVSKLTVNCLDKLTGIHTIM